MITEPLILSIDQGTQSVRAILFDLSGKVAAINQVQIKAYQSPKPGWAEQSAEYFWISLCEACQGLWKKSDIDKSRIGGVSLTTQRSTLVNVDEFGKPLRPAIVWLDQRRTQEFEPVRGLWGLAFRIAGVTETVRYLQAEAEANWIRINQPQIWENTYKFLYLSGFLTYKLTGDFIDSVGSQVGYLPFDYKTQDWAKKSDWKWQAVPVEPSMLPKLIRPTETLGTITKTAAEATGIPEGLLLIASAADKACEVLGAGCIEPNIGCLSFGTTATINTTHQKYIEVIPLLPPYPSAIPQFYNLEVQIFRGFWMVNWFKQEFGLKEILSAEEKGVSPEDLFNDLVKAVPPGSMGLMLQPYWSPGLKVPGPEAKGAVIGFGDVHTRAHFYRAILEGLGYALREGRERTERRNKIRITELMVSGGGSQSDAALQITADIFNLPTSRPHTYETSGLGAAIDAAIGLDFYSNFDVAVRSMTATDRTFEPDQEAVQQYDELYTRVYKQMYKRLQPLYEEIREITGYPAKY